MPVGRSSVSVPVGRSSVSVPVGRSSVDTSVGRSGMSMSVGRSDQSACSGQDQEREGAYMPIGDRWVWVSRPRVSYDDIDDHFRLADFSFNFRKLICRAFGEACKAQLNDLFH